ncbi:MAG TPA: DUF5666 domain-containing protein [Acidobacteriaceae bacterium]|nr:DUF5666 domain-containing protein [Acidobacteriaceae bacterium]
MIRFQLVSAGALGAALVAGCAGGGTGTGPLFRGNTTVVLLASSTANDQLIEFPLTLSSLTLTTQSGKTATLFSSPLSAEYIHLNGNIEPLTSVSIPQGIYTSATATYDGTAPVCLGQSTSGGLLIDGALNGPGTPTVTVNLPQPITVTGTAMGLVLNLQVSASAPFSGACAQNLSVPVSPVFDLTPLTIAAQPANSSNGKALGLVGTVTSIDANGAGFTVTAPIGYWNGNPPVWQVSTSGSTVFQGINSAAGLTTGIPVDMDVALQADGSLMATRVAVYNTDAMNAALSVGQLIMPGYPASSVDGLTAQESGGLAEYDDVFSYGSASSQISGQLTNLQNLPFAAAFNAADGIGGQNVLVTSNAPPVDGYPPLPLPIATMTLVPQTINGTVSAISTTGSFTTYTVTLAPYDLLPQLAEQTDQPTLASPNTVVVYADSGTQKLNSNSLSPGGIFRFYGLLFNDGGTLRMDCAQINDGVAE